MRPPPDDYVANGASRFQDVIKGGRVLGENGRKFPSPPPSSVADDSDEPIPTRFNAPASRARPLPPPDSSSSRRPYPSPSPVIDRSEEKQRSSPSSNFGSSFAFGASDRNRGLSSPVVSSPVHGLSSSSSVRSSGRYSRPPSSAASSHGDDARSTSTLRLPPPPPAPVSRNSNPYGSYASSDEDEVELFRPSSSSRPSQPTSSRFASPSLATVVTPPTPANNNSRRPDPTSKWSSTQASAAQTSQEDTDSAPESSEAESEAAPRRPPQSRLRYPEPEAVPSIHRNHRSNPSYAPQEDDSEAETDDAGYHRPQPQVANPRRRGAPPSPVDSEPPERQSGGYGYHSDTDGESVAAAFGGRHQKATAPAESDEEVGTRRRHGGGGGRPPIHRRDPSFSRTGSTFPFSDLEDDGGGSVRGSRRKEESESGSGSDVDSTTSEEDEEVGYGRGGGGGGSRRREDVPVRRNGGGGRRGEEEGMGAYGVAPAPAPRRGGVGAGQAPVEYSRRAARRLGR